MSNNGSITFSFDCEGKWGMADHPKVWDPQLTQKNLIKAYEFILNTLSAQNLSATFAFVGAFTETREQFLDESLPKLSSKSHKSWLDYSKERIISKTEEGWFMPELLELVKGFRNHEIATHSYTHIPFDTMMPPDAHIELELIRSWAVKKNVDCRTIVYPRNIVRHENLLKQFGIFAYRNSPNSFPALKLPKIVKSLINEVWIFQKAEKIDYAEPFKVPGGVFINWRYGFRTYIPSKISLLKYRNMIRDAGLQNRATHFWIHPHNFITSPETKDLFTKLCESASNQRDESGLLIKNQNDFLSPLGTDEKSKLEF